MKEWKNFSGTKDQKGKGYLDDHPWDSYKAFSRQHIKSRQTMVILVEGIRRKEKYPDSFFTASFTQINKRCTSIL